MQTITEIAPSSSGVMLWSGRIITGIVMLFMIFDVGIKLIEMEVVRDNMLRLGFPLDLAGGFQIGVIEAICLILYIVPRTSVLGAILLTAIMGGAITSHLRIGDPLLTHTLFGVYLGVLIWGGLWLRNPRLRELIPFQPSN
jgi:DoxX-like protein